MWLLVFLGWLSHTSRHGPVWNWPIHTSFMAIYGHSKHITSISQENVGCPILRKKKNMKSSNVVLSSWFMPPSKYITLFISSFTIHAAWRIFLPACIPLASNSQQLRRRLLERRDVETDGRKSWEKMGVDPIYPMDIYGKLENIWQYGTGSILQTLGTTINICLRLYDVQMKSGV